MEIMEIIMDAINYPLNHMKELGIYIGIMFVIFLILLLTIGGVAVGASFDSVATVGIVGIIGIVLVLLICLLVEGYGLDVVKLGIERSLQIYYHEYCILDHTNYHYGHLRCNQ